MNENFDDLKNLVDQLEKSNNFLELWYSISGQKKDYETQSFNDYSLGRSILLSKETTFYHFLFEAIGRENIANFINEYRDQLLIRFEKGSEK